MHNMDMSATFKMDVLMIIFVVGMMTLSGSSAELGLSQLNQIDLPQQLPVELTNTNATLDDAKKLLRDKCIEVAGEENGPAAFQDIEKAAGTLAECATSLVNYTAIQIEIDEASPRGELDVVFNKYCLKRSNMSACFNSFNSKIVPCLDKEEQATQDVIMRIINSLLNFICHKGGDQIALFIAEKGPECLKSKKDDIEQCLNNTFSGYIPADGLENIKTLPKFVMGEKQCKDLQNLEDCVVSKLETCSEITPANIVESMFRFIKNETICRTTGSMAAKQSGAKSDGIIYTVPNGLLIYGALLAMFMLMTKPLRA